MDRPTILAWLRRRDPERWAALGREADAVRAAHVGDAVHLRGLVEISNHCARTCLYCGLRAQRALPRYRMGSEEILDCARRAEELGYGTLVLQAGEDPGLTRAFVSELLLAIKAETPLAVTLSLGERPEADLAAWRDAGADRYLLRFETSDSDLLRQIHPPRPEAPASDVHPRLALLRRLRELGYETGGGMMVGIPGQTHESLADDLQALAALDVDMIGLGPFVAHPETPLGLAAAPVGPDQVPATERMARTVVSLARLLCPWANIPSTTALATLGGAVGQDAALACGANVVMPNLAPARYRRLYEIYPGKSGQAGAATVDALLRLRIEALGRTVGVGPGASPNWLRRHAAPPAKETP